MASVPTGLPKKAKRIFPEFEPTHAGVRVHVNSRVSLPGVFISQLHAERAYKRYIGSPTKSK